MTETFFNGSTWRSCSNVVAWMSAPLQAAFGSHFEQRTHKIRFLFHFETTKHVGEHRKHVQMKYTRLILLLENT